MNFYFNAPRLGPMNRAEAHNLRLMRQLLRRWGVRDTERMTYEACLRRLRLEHQRRTLQ